MDNELTSVASLILLSATTAVPYPCARLFPVHSRSPVPSSTFNVPLTILYWNCKQRVPNPKIKHDRSTRTPVHHNAWN